MSHKKIGPYMHSRIFFNLTDTSFDISFPETTCRINKRTSALNPWMTPGLLRSRKKKEKLAANKLKNPTPVNLEKYKTYNSIYNSTKRKAIQLHYNRKFEEHAKDIKSSWNTVKESLIFLD